MKRTMIEIEYQRTGKTESWGWIDHERVGKPIVTIEKFAPRRKRVAPHALRHTIDFLKHSCWSNVSQDTAMPTRLFLPPAKIVRIRKITVEYGEWGDV